MVKIKTADLVGAQLDYAVAIALGMKAVIWPSARGPWCRREAVIGNSTMRGPFEPSTQWADGGPIIEREDIATIPSSFGTPEQKWTASVGAYEHYIDESLPGFDFGDGQTGPTALIAAMRAFVASKLGDEVEVPEVQP